MFSIRNYLLLILFCSCQIAFAQPKESDNKRISRQDSNIDPRVDTLKTAVFDSAQFKDSIAAALKIADSLRTDSIQKAMALRALKHQKDTATFRYLLNEAYYPFFKSPINMFMPERKPNSKDMIFYILLGLVMMLAIIRIIFTKYIRNLFTLFFQTSFRQNQTRDQMVQDSIASLLTNLTFVLSGGIYISLMTNYFDANTLSFSTMVIYGSIAITVIYLFKYLFLYLLGWIFNVKAMIQSYNFVVFLLCKIIGVTLIPFLWLIAFSTDGLKQVAVTISICLLILLFIYRYIVGISIARKGIQVNALHFFLYLCCVEVLPLMLLFKVFNLYIGTIY